jgi:hypothetical protein
MTRTHLRCVLGYLFIVFAQAWVGGTHADTADMFTVLRTHYNHGHDLDQR